MTTLITYDATGHILSNITGSYYKPVGVPYLEVENTGKILTGVDVSVTPNVAIFEDAPVSEIVTITERLELMETAFNEFVLK